MDNNQSKERERVWSEVISGLSGRKMESSMNPNKNLKSDACIGSSAASSSSSSSSVSMSSSSSSSSSSPPQYSDDIRKMPNAPGRDDELDRKGSAASSTKTCEVDLGEEERDTFSPISSTNNSPDADDPDILNNCNGDAGPSSSSSAIRTTLMPSSSPSSSSKISKDNKQLDEIIPATSVMKLKQHSSTTTSTTVSNNNNSNLQGLMMMPSKEEKQRQNEEIVILETSSISSETGSWESIFPHNMNNPSTMASLETRNMNLGKFYGGDFMQSQMNETTETAETAETSHCMNRDLLLEIKRDDPLTTSQTSNCFIDASSLVDEDEVSSTHLTGGDSQIVKETETETETETANVPESPTKQLEEFHRTFARCKMKAVKEDAPHSSSSCSSDVDEVNDTPQNRGGISGGDSTSNISDEEKLWKRDHNHYENENENENESDNKCFKRNVNDQIENLAPCDETTEASVSLAHDVDSSDSSELIKLRREQERKFPLYNSHATTLPPLANKLLQHCNQPPASLVVNNAMPTTMHHNDFSYTTDYSSSSPAPSLAWSEYEHHQRSGGQQRFIINEDYEIIRKKSACLMPDTPHNSIVHIEPASSNTSSIHRDYTMSSSLSHNRDSGAYCSDATDSPVPMPRTPKRTKFDEANPIISGGSCIKDFQINQCESPPIQRKTDACPIVSGGFMSLEFERKQRPLSDTDSDCKQILEENRSQSAKMRKPLSGIASWVVDMSDCHRNDRNNERQRKSNSNSSTSSLDAFQMKFRERSDSNSSHKSGCGFYVPLNENDKKSLEQKDPRKIAQKDLMISNTQMSKSYDAPTSTKFFINLSASDFRPKEMVPKENNFKAKTETGTGTETETETETEGEKISNSESTSHKNLFSMFVDIGNGERKPLRPPGRKEPFHINDRLTGQRKMDDVMKSSTSSTETLMSKSITQHNTDKNIEGGETKSLDYSVNLEPSVKVTVTGPEIRAEMRPLKQASLEINKRHSWSISSNTDGNKVSCKRSTSFTNNDADINANNGRGQSKGLMNIIDKIPIISKASTMSIDSSLSPHEDNTFSKSEMSTSSGAEIEEMGTGVGVGMVAGTGRIKKRRQDAKLNETFDKSSVASIADSIISKDVSPMSNTTDTDDLTFQQDEEQAMRDVAALNDQQQNQQQLATLPTTNSTSNRMSSIIMETIIEAKEISSPKPRVSAISLEALHATIEKQKKLLETVNEHTEVEKCSFVKLSDMDKPLNLNVKSPDRMSASMGNHRQINRVYRDDNRIRPHSWTMTRSTGNSFLNITSSVENMRSLSRLFPNFSKEISSSLPNDVGLDNGMDYIQTDLSADSSMGSSISRSGMDESSISCRQPRRLGEDLLKMFLQEVATDMIVEVHGRRIKAHKCILRSRCQYFAAMLAGNQMTSVVSLQGYSYSAVHFALCHIYSGASHPPDGISLMELAALADLLGLEGLKEVTSHALKVNYCHNFHKPCSGCIDGILQVLPVALNHALDDLYRKCLRWTCRHYTRVWPTRQFSQLPPDVHGRCRQQIVAYLTSETVLDTILDCENLLAQLATYRWGNVCENLVRDILMAAYSYMADHFASLIASDAFLSLGHDRSCHIPLLEGVLLRTASSLTPDQVCRSYQRITRLNTVLQAKVIQMPASLGELAKELQGLQEEDLEWDPEYMRLVSALLSTIEQCLIRQCSRAMRVTSWQRMDLDLRKKIQTLARLTEPIDIRRNRSITKASSFGGNSRSQDLHQVKLVIQAHTKKSLAQDTQLFKATQTQDTVQTIEKGVQANHEPREGRLFKSSNRASLPLPGPGPGPGPGLGRGITQSSSGANRNSRANLIATNHRRTKSEAPVSISTSNANATKYKAIDNTIKKSEGKMKPNQPLKLSDVKPRYLEPKKPINNNQGPVRSSTTSSIPATNTIRKSYTHSSSESSRRSSPAARRHANVKATGIKSTTNMSLDSLASTENRRGRCKTSRSSDNERFSDVFADSLESVNTNRTKTVSHESLNSNRLTKQKVPMKISGNTKKTEMELNDKMAKTKNNKQPIKKPARPTSLTAKPAAKYIQHKITSTGSSPSSITTTKSATSRLSSVSSTQSARTAASNNYKRSISTPGYNDGPGIVGAPKFSFLSAKSREILAKRAEKNKQLQEEKQQSQQQKAGSEEKVVPKATIDVIRSASHTSVLTARPTSMTTNIPMRRPNTLQLKKTGTNSGVAGINAAGNAGGNCIVHSSQINNYSNNNNNKNRLTTVTRNNNTQQQQQQQQKLTGTQALYQTAHAVKQKIELLIKSSNRLSNDAAATPTTEKTIDNSEQVTNTVRTFANESKLERSGTFCKDSAESGIEFNELHIIE